MWVNKTTSGMFAALVISILCVYFCPGKESKTKTTSYVSEHTANIKSMETSIEIDAAIYFAPLKTSLNDLAEDQSIQTTGQKNEETKIIRSEEITNTRSILENQSSINTRPIESSNLNQFETSNYFESEKSKSEKARNNWEFSNTDNNENTLTETISVTSLPKENEMQNSVEKEICYEDMLRNRSRICRPKCAKNSFALPGMTNCLPWLTCEQINSLVKMELELDSSGTVKIVHLAKWLNYSVALLKLKDEQYRDDFKSGLEVLKLFNGENNVVQLIGYCEKSNTIITEYHPMGNVLNFLRLLINDDRFKTFDTVAARFNLCLNYAKILEFLHNHPRGSRIMCDSSQLGKVLHQYLVTNGLELILSDVDAVPLLGSDSKLVCGSRMLDGDLLAPEQQWQLQSEYFDVSKQNRYDEKADIWKIPDVCNFFLGNNSDIVNYHLFDIHSKCKDQSPNKRPSAKQVVNVYKQVYKFLIGE